MNYYNEFDRKAAAWLRELIKEGLIPKGEVDERSITEVRPSELAGYAQCHFFAGIGGWPYALRLARWPEDRPIWTGSCPCQPFSVCGKRKGTADERHLWPVFAKLIGVCRPATVAGEQVASAAGRQWLNGVFADLEGMGYRCAGADLCAASRGAPHIRQRLFWVADSHSGGLEVREERDRKTEQDSANWDTCWGDSARTGGNGGRATEHCRMGDSSGEGLEGSNSSNDSTQGHWEGADGRAGRTGRTAHWDASRWHYCRDGKFRRVPLEPSLFPLAARLPGRVGLLRGAGNAIVPQLAATFVEAFLGCSEDKTE